MKPKEENRGRNKIFLKGKKPVNIDQDIYDMVIKESEDRGLYASQVIHKILKNYFKEK